MGSFETGISDNVLVDAAERVITANINLDWEKVESHADIERIAQDIEVEAYCAQRRIAGALHSIASIMKAQTKIKTVMASINGDAFEKKYAELKDVDAQLAMATTDLQSYLLSAFGSVIDPMMAIRLIHAAKKGLLRHAEDIAQEIPGYELIKPSDAGRAVTSPSKGTGHVTHVEPEQVLIVWDNGSEEWIGQEALATADVKLEDESGTAVTAEGDGDTAASAVQGPSDSPDGTIGMEDRERNPLMDYLQGYELDEEEQEGPKKAPSQAPKPSKMTMSAAFGDYDVDPDSAEGLAESFINGNISDVRSKIRNNANKFNAVLQILQEVSPESIESFQRLMARGSVGQPDDKPGATKSNPQEPETINPTPKKIKYRLEALDEATKTWKEVGVYDSMEKANEKSDEMKAELPMTMETQVTPLVGLDKDGNPDYKTTPKGPEGDNTEQTVKEVKAAGGAADASYEAAVNRYLDKSDFDPTEWLEGEEATELASLQGADENTSELQDTRFDELYEKAVQHYLDKTNFNPSDWMVVKAADEYEDINANKPGARYCSTCDQWLPAGSGMGKDKTGCPGCWSPTMTAEEKMQTESSLKKEAVAPEGWEGTVKKLKKHKDKVDNPWALAWWMKGEGYKPGVKGRQVSAAASAGTILDQMKKVIESGDEKRLAWELDRFEHALGYAPGMDLLDQDDWRRLNEIAKARDMEGFKAAIIELAPKYADQLGTSYEQYVKKVSSLSYRQGAWELWLADDKESPIISQDPAVLAYVAANKLNWSLKRASAIMRYVKDLDMPFVIY